MADTDNGGVIAYKYDAVTGQFKTLWVGHDSTGKTVEFSMGATGWGGPSLIDLDDDGKPEILSGGLVYDSTGLLLDSTLGLAGVYKVGFPVCRRY